MFGEGKTYFAGNPVIIDISGLEWPMSGGDPTSPFNIVRVEVVYNGFVWEVRQETGGKANISIDISAALRGIWSTYEFDDEVTAANGALTSTAQTCARDKREYSLRIYTIYKDSTDGEYTETQCADSQGRTEFTGGRCIIGGRTEWERSLITDNTKRDVSALEKTNPRNGDASTKPRTSPERVGSESITSWVDVNADNTTSIFYPKTAISGEGNGAADDTSTQQTWSGHAPIVLRDSVPYVDFLFINRRGAVETCSGQTLEAMGINVENKQYSRNGGAAFRPTRTLMSFGADGRRSWQMSSGYVTREWAEWWAMEFLSGKRKQWWMRYPIGDAAGTFVPVVIEPAKKEVSIYDRSKQEMPHVDFTVTLALEG